MLVTQPDIRTGERSGGSFSTTSTALALEFFFEAASPAEVQERLRPDVYVTQVEVAVG
jgi:hypothetical protein